MIKYFIQVIFADNNNFDTQVLQVEYLLYQSQFIYSFHSKLMQNKRAQTAFPYHRVKHQDSMLKQIQTIQSLQNMIEPHPKTSKRLHFNRNKSTQSLHCRRRELKKQQSIYNSPMGKQIMDIEQIRRKEQKKGFSFAKDQNKINIAGWKDFEDRVQRSTHNDLQHIRKKVRQMRTRMSVSNICLKDASSRKEEFRDTTIGQQSIKDLWNVAKGGTRQPFIDNYLKIRDLTMDIKGSVVLSNAYMACLNSKIFKSVEQSSLNNQKLQSYVYLNEIGHKLPKKKIDQLMKNNYFLP